MMLIFWHRPEKKTQRLKDRFYTTCVYFRLKIILEINVNNVYSRAGTNIFVNRTRLEVIDTFVYPTSTLSRDGSLDAEIYHRAGKGSVAFGKLKKRVWTDRDVSLQTKTSVYKTFQLSTLLYIIWTTYMHRIKCWIDCIKRAPGVKWECVMLRKEALRMERRRPIESHIILAQRK